MYDLNRHLYSKKDYPKSGKFLDIINWEVEEGKKLEKKAEKILEKNGIKTKHIWL